MRLRADCARRDSVLIRERQDSTQLRDGSFLIRHYGIHLEVRVDAANWAINDRQVLGKERLVAFVGFTVS